MILIVADTGPINYLIQIGLVGLLAQVASKTVLPESVAAELAAAAAPEIVRAWMTSPPPWVEVRTANQPIGAPDIAVADREAIALARELGSSVLLMDDQQARRCAASHGVVTMGTLGLLEVAASRGFVSLPVALEKLRATSCFLSDELIKNALLRDEARRHTQARDV